MKFTKADGTVVEVDDAVVITEYKRLFPDKPGDADISDKITDKLAEKLNKLFGNKKPEDVKPTEPLAPAGNDAAMQGVLDKLAKMDKRFNDKEKAEKDAVTAENKKAAEKLVNKAIKDGKIPVADKAEWITDFEANHDLTAKSLGRQKADPAIVRQNQTPGDGSGEPGKPGAPTDKKPSGQAVFSRADINKMSVEEYSKAAPEIQAAMAAGNIID